MPKLEDWKIGEFMARLPAVRWPSTGIIARVLKSALIAGATLVSVPSSASSEILLERAVVVTGEWPPFTSERADGAGLLSSLVKEVLKGMDRVPDYQFLPFSAALDTTREGRAMGTFPWFWNEQRARDFLYSDPILDVEYVIFYDPTSDSPVRKVRQFEDLKDLKTVRVAGYAYGKLDCLIDYRSVACPDDPTSSAEKTERVESEFRAFEALLNGKVDYVAASSAVGEALLSRSFSVDDQHRITVLDRPGLSWSMGVHFLFSRNRADAESLKRAFDVSLAEVEASGRIAELREDLAWAGHWRDRDVVLEAGGATDPIVGYPHLGEADYVVLPRGTRAVVIQWSPGFLGRDVDLDTGALSQLQLLNGPMRGARFWVRDDLIRLAE